MTEPAPWRWFVLNLPFGATAGYVAVTLGYIARRDHLSTTVAAGLAAASVLPHAWKFLWAPLTDATLTRKRWYVIATTLCALTLGGIGFLPLSEDLALVTTLVLVNAVTASFVGMAAGGLMTLTTSSARLGRAAGAFQAGNLGGMGIGGGLALLVAQHVGDGEASLVTAALIAACMLALIGMPDPQEPRERELVAAFRAVGRDAWSVFASKNGLIAILFCLVPLMAGSLTNLFANLAVDWRADDDLVALVNGLLGGAVSMVGAIFGGTLADRIGKRVAFLAAGVLVALVTLLFALLPMSPATYAAFVLCYGATSGLCFGTFAAFVFDVIGKGAAATKYNLLASAANVPILYMTVVDGAVHDANGVSAMLAVDALARLGALVLLALVGRRVLREALPARGTRA